MLRQRGSAKRTRGVVASSPVTGLLPLATMTCDVSALTTPPASMSSAAVSPARTCRSLGKALASQVSAAVCGSSSRASLASYDRASSSWRTSQLSFLAGSTACSVTLPKQGMMRSGSIFELPTLAPLTAARESSSSRGSETWATARVSAANGASAAEVAAGDPRGRLETQVAVAQGSAWPTPAARDFKDTGASPAEFNRNTPGLAARAVALAVMDAVEEVLGIVSLNPDWVSRLMGFPDEWTSPLTSGPSAHAKRRPKASRRASRRSGGSADNG